MKRKIMYFVSFLVSLLIWLIASFYIDNEIVMPSPFIVFNSLFTILGEKQTYIIIVSTLKRLIISVSFSLLMGLVFGILSGVFVSIKYLLEPFVTTIRVLPVISIIILILIWFGMDLAPYIISFLLIFPIIYQGVLGGMENIDQRYLDVALLDSSKISWKLIIYLYIPIIFPFIKVSLLQGIGLGIKVLVMAEFLSQTQNSIGFEIYWQRNMLNYDLVFAWTIILIVIVSIIEIIVKKYSKSKIIKK